jgi:uncharacterized protein
LRSRQGIYPKRVFLVGHSLGGTLAPRMAAQDKSLAGIIIMAGARRPLEEVARDQLVYLASLTPNGPSPDEGLQALRRAAPESYWKDLSYKPASVAASPDIPMLILQGERDDQVTQADLDGWRDALASRKNVTIKRYPTLNHLFMLSMAGTQEHTVRVRAPRPRRRLRPRRHRWLDCEELRTDTRHLLRVRS